MISLSQLGIIGNLFLVVSKVECLNLCQVMKQGAPRGTPFSFVILWLFRCSFGAMDERQNTVDSLKMGLVGMPLISCTYGSLLTECAFRGCLGLFL